MKMEIEEFNRGFLVTYTEKDGVFKYVYENKQNSDLFMLEEVAKRFLKRRVKIEEK